LRRDPADALFGFPRGYRPAGQLPRGSASTNDERWGTAVGERWLAGIPCRCPASPNRRRPLSIRAMCEPRPGRRRCEEPCQPPLEPLGRPLSAAGLRGAHEPGKDRRFRRTRAHNLGPESRPEENIRVPPARSLLSFAASNSGPEGKGHGLEDRPYRLFRVAPDRSLAVWPGLALL